jgi:GINS complex subunit 1
MSNFGAKGASLVLDITQSEKGTIPPYNDETVRAVVEESQEHHRSILKLIGDIQRSGASLEEAKPDDAASILVHHQAVLRNKRALLVYLNERMSRVRALRWEVGTALPEVVGENMSPSERSFFTQYSALVNKYQGRRGGVGLNLTLDPTPPRDHKVQVRVLEDYGEIVTRDGTVDLSKNTVHLLWRDEAQPLITEGVLEKLDDN